MNILYDAIQGDPLTPEEFIELRKLRTPRPEGYVVEHPEWTIQCEKCLNDYPIELMVLQSWKPVAISCPECHGITA